MWTCWSQTVEVLEGEEGEDEAEEVPLTADSDDHQDTQHRTTQNTSLGLDGKPSPYWLYKLHGLNIPVTYECHICGGPRYHGPKTFYWHFSELCHVSFWIALRGISKKNSSFY